MATVAQWEDMGRQRADYRVAMLDWLACAHAGARERAAQAVARAVEGLPGAVAVAATAGHVLDFDDTYGAGVAHISAACAPAALLVAADLGASVGAALAAYADGFEAMAALAAASHPSLYERGWHPTAVCAPVGAAVAAAGLLGLSPDEREHALALAVLRAGGTRGAFGSDGKAIQVGLATAAGVQAALLARAGATVDRRAVDGPLGFTAVLGARWVLAGEPAAGARAIDGNWIKLHPSCLGTHAPIEAAERARAAGHGLDSAGVEVLVHPRARQAAHLDDVEDGLAAKFSIPYCVAHTFAHGAPRVRDFDRVDGATRAAARCVRVDTDPTLPEFGTVLRAGGRELARLTSPRGAPDRPLSQADLAAKVASLAGRRLDGVLDDLDAPAARAVTAAGLA